MPISRIGKLIVDKMQLRERAICTKFITYVIQQASWQRHEFREEVQPAALATEFTIILD
jgi:hypothetical protein